MKKDIYRSSRVGNIISAALEYFISMLVIDSYLAKLTTDIGISDSVTGILTSFVSLGFGFQLFAIFLINKKPVKRWVTALTIINQLFFAFVYVIPFFEMSKTVKQMINEAGVASLDSIGNNGKAGKVTLSKTEKTALISKSIAEIFADIIDGT
jgi:hypothetical protein